MQKLSFLLIQKSVLMNPDFKHFLITQFNLRSFPKGVKGNENWIKWTKKRIDIFKTYCLPSILNQSNKDFSWLIYFDKDTPIEFSYIISELKRYSFIYPCFTSGFEGFNLQYINDIKKIIAADTKWMITTRMDNDDCFEKDAINTIQKHFRKSDEFLISLSSGYTLNLQDNFLSHYYYPMSPFISLIELTEKPVIKGIFFNLHTEWDGLRLVIFKEILKRNNKSIFILDKPYWIQLVHGENVSNTAKRGFPVLYDKCLKNFGIPNKSKKQSILQIYKYYNYVIWKRYLKAMIVKCFS